MATSEPTTSTHPSATSQASAQPLATDAGAPPVFQNWALATIRVNGLAVRQEPSTTAPVISNPVESEPVRLDAGDHVLVISDAREAGGLWWLRVVIGSRSTERVPIGWAAAGTADDPWIEEDNSFCPEPTLEALIDLTGIERVGCYGSAPITFDAYPAVLPPDAGLGGACRVESEDAPRWLLCDHINYSWVNPGISRSWGFQLHWDPATGLDEVQLVPEGEPVPQLRITGHFDDPAAAACGLEAGDEPGAEALHWMCAGLFVVETVVEL